MPVFHVFGLGNGEPESFIDLLVIDSINWVIRALLIFSLESFQANESVSVVIFGLEIVHFSLFDVAQFIGKFFPVRLRIERYQLPFLLQILSSFVIRVPVSKGHVKITQNRLTLVFGSLELSAHIMFNPC